MLPEPNFAVPVVSSPFSVRVPDPGKGRVQFPCAILALKDRFARHHGARHAALHLAFVERRILGT